MTSTPDQPAADVREYVRVIRVRKFEILLVVMVLVSAAMILSFKQIPIFEGTSKVLVRPIQPATTSAAIPQQPNLDTERELLTSQVVAQQVRADTHVSIPLDDLLKNLRVQVVTDTEVLLVKFDDPDRATPGSVADGRLQIRIRAGGEELARDAFMAVCRGPAERRPPLVFPPPRSGDGSTGFSRASPTSRRGSTPRTTPRRRTRWGRRGTPS